MIAWEIAELLKALTKIAAGDSSIQISNTSRGTIVKVVANRP